MDLEPLLVQHATAIKLAQSQFELDVVFEQLLLGAHADRGAHDLARAVEIELADLELGKEGPDLGKSELLVRNELETGFEDLAYAAQVLFGERAGVREVEQFGIKVWKERDEPWSRFPRTGRS